MPKRARQFKPQDLNAVRGISQLDATEDGKLVAMTVTEPHSDGTRMVGRVWLLDESAREGARPITVEDVGAGAPKFSPDGTKLAFVAERGEKDKKKAQLCVLSAPFGEAVTLTKFTEGVCGFEWMGAGALLVLAPADRPEAKRKAVEGKDDAYEVDVDEPRARMWRVSVSGGKPRPIGPADGHVCCASVSRDGKRVAWVHASHSTMHALWSGSELRMLDLKTGRSKTLRQCSSPGATGWAPRFSPDGRRIVFVDSPKKGELYPLRVFVVDVEGKRVVQIDRAADRIAAAPKWLDDDTIVYLIQNATALQLRRAPSSGKEGSVLLDAPGTVADYVVSAKGIHFVYSETDRPCEVYGGADIPVCAAEGKQECLPHRLPSPLTSINAKLQRMKHATCEVVRWKSKEGWDVEGLLMLPTTGARKPFATIVVPHGGPHGIVGNSYDRLQAQVFCASGYAAFMPNFRGSTGYGERFMMAIRRDWGHGPADDIVRGIRSLERKGIVDPKRIVVNGGSYGGYMTAWLIGHYDIFRAAVAHAPVVNNISMWGTTDIPGFIEWSSRARILSNPRPFWDLSPVRWLTKCKTPTMVITGDVDLRVPVGQSQELYRTVKTAGAPARFIRYPREPHGLGEPRHKVDASKRILAWFREHLKKDAP